MKKDALLCKEIAFFPLSGVHEILVLEINTHPSFVICSSHGYNTLKLKTICVTK